LLPTEQPGHLPKPIAAFRSTEWCPRSGPHPSQGLT
jgi:hypothetical protein